MPHIAVIYQDGSVFDVSLQENFSPSKNLLIKLPDDTNDKDDRGKRYAYQDQIGTLYFFSSTISRPVTQLQQKSRFHTITHNGQKLFDLDRRVKLYSGTQLGNKFWVWGDYWAKANNVLGASFSCCSCLKNSIFKPFRSSLYHSPQPLVNSLPKYSSLANSRTSTQHTFASLVKSFTDLLGSYRFFRNIWKLRRGKYFSDKWSFSVRNV